MTQIYMGYAWEPGDTPEQRMNKLYLGIISCGERSYQLGAELNEIDKTVTQMRRDLEALKALGRPTNRPTEE